VTITEKFRKKYGKSVMSYVLEERMKLAAELLSERGQTVAFVAASCGFSDVEYFSKTFKNYYGKPPSLWRSNAYK
jgi:two-component system response regulator YesN